MRKILVAIALAALPVALSAATATGTLGVSATVLAGGTCTVSSSAIGFGSLTPPISANVDASTAVQVTCPTSVGYSVSLSAGGAASYSPRKLSMTGTPSNTMNYNIYTSETFTTVWGDGTGETAVVAGTGAGGPQNLWINGRIPPQPTPAAGEYADSITITVTY